MLPRVSEIDICLKSFIKFGYGYSPKNPDNNLISTSVISYHNIHNFVGIFLGDAGWEESDKIFTNDSHISPINCRINSTNPRAPGSQNTQLIPNRHCIANPGTLRYSDSTVHPTLWSIVVVVTCLHVIDAQQYSPFLSFVAFENDLVENNAKLLWGSIRAERSNNMKTGCVILLQ